MSARNDVVFQNAGKLWWIFYQGLYGTGWELGKGVIVGGEDGKRARGSEGVDKACGLDSGDKGGEAVGVDSDFDDVWHRERKVGEIRRIGVSPVPFGAEEMALAIFLALDVAESGFGAEEAVELLLKELAVGFEMLGIRIV